MTISAIENLELRLTKCNRLNYCADALSEVKAHIDAQAARIAELENDELRQRLANAEHQLYMKDLAIHNVKASRRAQFRARQAAEKELSSLRNDVSTWETMRKANGLPDTIGATILLAASLRQEMAALREPVPADPVAVPDDVTSGELYRIANHIAGAKDSLPDEWQPWAEDVEDSLRKLLRLNSGSKPHYASGSLAQLRDLIRQRHAEWSEKTFGNVGPIGPLKHLSVEALEAAEDVGDLSEWADMQFLLWDAQRRAGVSDGEIIAAMEDKLKVNMARQWPEPKDGEPRMHIKGTVSDED